LCFPILFSFLLTRKSMGPLTPVVLAIAALPFFFNIHWIGKTGFIVIYALFFAGYLAARNIVYWEHFAKSPYLYPLALISTLIVFFPTPHFDSLFLGKFFKFLYIPTIPIMVLSTGIDGGLLNKIFSVAWIGYIGRATYSIYLWQQLFTGELFFNLQPAIHVLLIFLMICCCLVLFEIIERRLIKLGRNISNELHGTRHYLV
jgi:peptidoglycan/LPS O-acetylase OafA/YrhL